MKLDLKTDNYKVNEAMPLKVNDMDLKLHLRRDFTK